jgi:putative Holliday junction resolvase
VLAFDFGTRRIGVAVGNTLTRVAQPLATVADKSGDARLAAIATLVAQWQPQRLIVGIPVHADGTAHATTALARRFAGDLGRRFQLPVECADERFTTQVARSAIAEAGVRGAAARAARDQVSAQLILQGWFDERRDGTA